MFMLASLREAPPSCAAPPPMSPSQDADRREQLPYHFAPVKILPRDLARRCSMARVIRAHRLDGCKRPVHGRKRQQANSGGDVLPEARVLRDHRASCCEIADASIAEPAGVRRSVLLLGGCEFA